MEKQKYPVQNNAGPRAFGINEMKIEINGMKVVLEKKVALLPVNILEKKTDNGKPL